MVLLLLSICLIFQLFFLQSRLRRCNSGFALVSARFPLVEALLHIHKCGTVAARQQQNKHSRRAGTKKQTIAHTAQPHRCARSTTHTRARTYDATATTTTTTTNDESAE
uniref:Putative secreted peptide n=1 Tax=Anopheles braziliensis TaxID=58242 RepID=A0A2M3ZPU1_9DIPT